MRRDISTEFQIISVATLPSRRGNTTPTLQMWDCKETSFKKDCLGSRKSLTDTPAGEQGQYQR